LQNGGSCGGTINACVFLLLLVVCVFAGCGGGGRGIAPAAVVPFDNAAYQQMVTVEDHAVDQYQQALLTGDAATAAAAVVAWAQTQPNVVSSGADPNGTDVWMTFNTGVTHVIMQMPVVTAADPLPLALQSRQALTRDEVVLAGNNLALDLNADWPDWPTQDNDDFREMLTTRGYKVDSLVGDQVTVAAFRALTKYSVVHIDTHGPSLAFAQKNYPFFLTREKVTAEKDNATFANDLRQQGLIHVTPVGLVPQRTIEQGDYYAVTPDDIKAMPGTFPQQSFVFADACSSMANLKIANAFQARGLTAYAGWDRPVSVSGAANAACVQFDALTAAYKYWHRPDPTNGTGFVLPMNLGNAYAKMKKNGYGTLAKVGAELLLAFGNEVEFQFAAIPHLDSAILVEGILQLKGNFGTGTPTVYSRTTDTPPVINGPYTMSTFPTADTITVAWPGTTDKPLLVYVQVHKINSNALMTREMVQVRGGTFTMGSNFNVVGSLYGEPKHLEQPAHQVTLSDYWIDKYEVTVAQYRAFCTATGHALPSFPGDYSWTDKTGWDDPALQQHPIMNVRWDDAKAYADWAGLTLPTEAQWEYAARGPAGNNYPWGGTATASDPYNGWDQTKCANHFYLSSQNMSTRPVGSFPAGVSWCGAQDMEGNAWEWCADWYGVYSALPVTDPIGPAAGNSRILRGAPWDIENVGFFRSAFRYSSPGGIIYMWGDSRIGFRCVKNAPGP
jgi:sulfatase modifying factor 1